MDIQKISIKLYNDGDVPPLTAFVPVFHRWIQEDSLDELLLDVADYSHVPAGPGIILIAEEANYSFEPGPEERFGMLYSCKAKCAGSNRDRLTKALRKVLTAASLLELEKGFGLRFSGREISLCVNDRSAGPNVDDTLALLRADLDAVFGLLYAGNAYSCARVSHDARERFTVRIAGSDEDGLATLKRRMIA
jgi:hypothetical protein